jgi:hypothetical protein
MITAFWHVRFCAIMVVIMILWRPSNNNERYAFTPEKCDDAKELKLAVTDKSRTWR